MTVEARLTDLEAAQHQRLGARVDGNSTANQAALGHNQIDSVPSRWEAFWNTDSGLIREKAIAEHNVALKKIRAEEPKPTSVMRKAAYGVAGLTGVGLGTVALVAIAMYMTQREDMYGMYGGGLGGGI